MAKIKDLTDIISSEERVIGIFKEEISYIRNKYNDKRRTDIVMIDNEIDIEDLIEEEMCVYTLTHYGYIKRLPCTTYKTQKRGGRGITAMTTREEDFVEELFIGSTHDFILFFSNKGRVYRIKGYEIAESGRTAKGTNIINLLPMASDEKISAMIPVREFTENSYLFFGTKNGVVKKTSLVEYNTARRGGLNAIVLDDGDELVRVKLTDGNSDIILGTHKGIAIKFNENDVRAQGRTTRGVRGIRLNTDDYVVGVAKADIDTTLLSVTENGYGKRTNVSDYRLQTRGGKGIINYNISDKTGDVVGMKVVTDDDDIMIISSDGVIIRIKACDISVIGRSTSGVKIMRLSPDIKLVTIAKTNRDEEDENTDIEIVENLDSSNTLPIVEETDE